MMPTSGGSQGQRLLRCLRVGAMGLMLLLSTTAAGQAPLRDGRSGATSPTMPPATGGTATGQEGPARADTHSGPAPHSNAGGVIVAFSSVPRPALKTFAGESLDAGAEADPPVVDPAEERFILALQRLEFIGRVKKGGPAAPPCKPTTAQLSVMVREAGEALEFLDLEQARMKLTDARHAFRCGTEPAARATLSRLLFLEGVLRTLEKRDGVESFEAALAVEPGLRFPSEQSSQVQAAFKEAKRRLERKPSVNVKVPAPGSGQLVLRIDGVAPTGSSLTLKSGRHLLQWVGPDDRAVIGFEVQLGPSSGAPVAWPPEGMRPATPEALLVALEKEVLSGRVTMSAPLQSLLREWKLEWMVLVAREPLTGEVRSLRVHQEGALVAERMQVKLGGPSTGGKLLVAGLGVTSLASAGYYGYAYYRLKTERFEDLSEGEALRRRGIVAGAISGSALAGTLLSSWRVFWKPDRPQPSSVAGAAFSAFFAPGAAAIRLEGQW